MSFLRIHVQQPLFNMHSFGTTIGAPILFFVGGFIYTILGIENGSLQGDDTVHALAFGMCKSHKAEKLDPRSHCNQGG